MQKRVPSSRDEVSSGGFFAFRNWRNTIGMTSFYYQKSTRASHNPEGWRARQARPGGFRAWYTVTSHL